MNKKSKRVLFLASQPFFEKRGSPIRLGFDLLSLSELGYEVEFITLPLGERREIQGVKTTRVPNLFFAKKISIGPSPLKLAFDFLILLYATWRVLFNKYAVVHGVEDCGIIALFAGRIGGAKVVFERHSDPESYSGARGAKKFLLEKYKKIERHVILRADAVICTGPGLVENAKKMGCASRACMIADIPSSLKTASAGQIEAARERFAADPGTVLAGYVGSFAAYQGIDLLFKSIPLAARENPNLKFIIIGGSPVEVADRRAQLAEDGVLDRVEFAGFVDPDELPAWLSAFDILLSPRISGLNTPLKLLDYLKSGAAIAATDCPANRLILDENTALLASPDPAGFANAVLRLAQDAGLREKLARNGKTVLDERHNFKCFKEGLRQCYEYALSPKNI